MVSKISTDVDFQVFTHGNIRKNSESLLSWVRQNELKRDQIVSIQTCETSVEEGDNVLVLFYRKQSSSPGEMPLENLQFHIFDNTQGWEALADEAEDFAAKGTNMVSLTHTPKGVGQLCNQVMWFTREQGQGPYNITAFSDRSGDLKSLIEKTRSWLNKFIAPHQLVGVSFFENSHPNDDDKTVHAVVTHTAGADPQPLSSIN